MARVNIAIKLQGVGWQRFQDKLKANLIGAKEMSNTRFMIGTSLPYASHWIEEGWRDDPRFGRVTIQYRSPADANFMRDTADNFGKIVRLKRPTSKVLGVAFSGRIMVQLADIIVQDMRTNLNNTVYSAPVPTRNGRKRYTRSLNLFRSIRAYRV